MLRYYLFDYLIAFIPIYNSIANQKLLSFLATLYTIIAIKKTTFIKELAIIVKIHLTSILAIFLPLDTRSELIALLII